MARPANQKDFNPETTLSSPETILKITDICTRNFSDENEANECFTYIIDSLKADDFRRLRLYAGKSRVKTYIYTTVHRLIIDFRRRKYGRRRIPVQVRKQGDWAERVYDLVCWKKFTYDDAFDIISDEKRFNGSYTEYMDRIEAIRTAPCKENPSFQSLDASSGNSAGIDPGDATNPLEALIDKLEREKRLAAMGIIRKVMATLSDEEQLLVRLVYGSGRKVAAAGRAVGISNATAARRRLNGLILKFREALLKKGIRES